MKKQINVRLSEPGQLKLAELSQIYGSQTIVVEMAIDRLYRKEVTEMKDTKAPTDRVAKTKLADGIGKSYDELVTMATASYWVKPINTDNPAFHKHYRILDRAQDGQVHYG